MKKSVIVVFVCMLLLAGCSNATEILNISIYQSQLPEITSFWIYGTFIDAGGDLYTWGFDNRNAGNSSGSYPGNSLGQGTKVIYNNTPTKIFSGVACTDTGSRGLTKSGEIIEWGKRMDNDSCVPVITKKMSPKWVIFCI